MREVAQAHRRVSAFLQIPVDRGCGIVGRQVTISPAGVIVDGPQRAHAAIRDIGAVILGYFVVLGDHLARVVGELLKGNVQPILEQALDVIAITLDRPLAAPLANEMGIPISLPCFTQRDTLQRNPLLAIVGSLCGLACLSTGFG